VRLQKSLDDRVREFITLHRSMALHVNAGEFAVEVGFGHCANMVTQNVGKSPTARMGSVGSELGAAFAPMLDRRRANGAITMFSAFTNTAGAAAGLTGESGAEMDAGAARLLYPSSLGFAAAPQNAVSLVRMK
jgi:hypothetical protein